MSDNAFGRCEEPAPASSLSSDDNGEPVAPSSSNVYQLDRKTLQLLEKEVDRLHDEGFDWADAYTQCVLKTILNDRPRVFYDASRCDNLREPPPAALPPYVDLLITESNGDEAADSIPLGPANTLPDGGYFVEEVSNSVNRSRASGTVT